jgi:hypothetical protein
MASRRGAVLKRALMHFDGVSSCRTSACRVSPAPATRAYPQPSPTATHSRLSLMTPRSCDVGGADALQGKPVADTLINDASQLLGQRDARVAGRERRQLGEALQPRRIGPMLRSR